ncbi:hypothetical protein G4Y79_13010 [Phototrophicus methaneseepsis]|uniref:Uncharacterized protein n=1 Tax=Phototrophicus methaneseepsis TaxID=2710758 RepID=A0A7S8E596_9CHLR|nr:hypothetical protein [Phototrophicus methaneseepsis]QPC80631.1 hypothetical protein G4Y79_13010 [Phototrophicus methaneseepsis]
MSFVDIHNILFNMIIFYAVALGIYAAVLGARKESLSGNFWGGVMVFAVLCAVTLAVGIILILNGYTVESNGRIVIYILYMLFLTIIMPGLFSMLSGRDDRKAAIYFAVLSLFNAAVAFSMAERGLTTWILANAS